MIKANVQVTCDSWAEFKKYIDGTYKKLYIQYIPIENGYEVFTVDEAVLYNYVIFNSSVQQSLEQMEQHAEDIADFETNWKPIANKSFTQQVITKQWDLIPQHLARTTERGYTIPYTIGNAISTTVIGFNYQVDVIYGSLLNHNVEDDDFVEINIGPKTDPVLGLLTADSAQEGEMITVSDTILPYLRAGYALRIGEEDKRYYITWVSAGMIGIEPPLVIEKHIGDTLRFYVPYARNRWLSPSISNYVGATILEPSGLDITMQINVVYHHKTAPTQDGEMKVIVMYRY